MNKSGKELLDKCIKLEMDEKLPLFKGVVKEIDGDLRINTELLEKILTEKILPVIRNIVE